MSLTRPSPISSLPPELLLVIFTHARDLTCTPTSALFAVLQTCHLWRDLALDSPILFATITAPTVDLAWRVYRTKPGHNGCTPYIQETKAIERFLGLAKECPITYQAQTHQVIPDPRLVNPPLEVHRWRSEDVRVSSVTSTAHGRNAKEEGYYDMLQFVSRQWTVMWAGRLFGGSCNRPTRLREVEFIDGPRPVDYDLPWAQLTRITLSGRMQASIDDGYIYPTSDVEEYIAILQRSDALTRFEARWEGPEKTSSRTDLEPARFVHHVLKHLVLRDLTLLRCVDFPGLERLDLIYRYTSLKDEDARFLDSLRIPRIKIQLEGEEET